MLRRVSHYFHLDFFNENNKEEEKISDREDVSSTSFYEEIAFSVPNKFLPPRPDCDLVVQDHFDREELYFNDIEVLHPRTFKPIQIPKEVVSDFHQSIIHSSEIMSFEEVYFQKIKEIFFSWYEFSNEKYENLLNLMFFGNQLWSKDCLEAFLDHYHF